MERTRHRRVLLFSFGLHPHKIPQHKEGECRTVKENMEERCQALAAYIIENKATVRAAAKI